MTDNNDQLATLGQQVINSLLATYNPEGDPELALAILPGQVLDSGLVQDGKVNPLPVSQWLHDEYDDPMLLRLADGTPLPISVGSGVPATAVYTTIAQWAQPSGTTEEPGYARVTDLIAQARQDLGSNPSPDILTLGCEPDDFAADSSLAWTVFDTHLTSETTKTVETPGQRVDPHMWRVRAMPAELVAQLPQRREAMIARRAQVSELSAAPPTSTTMRMAFARKAMIATPVVEAAPVEAVAAVAPTETLTAVAMPVRSFAATRQVRRVDPSVLSVAAVQTDESQVSVMQHPVRQFHVDPQLLSATTRVQFSDLTTAPTVSTVTTTSDLHVHFEHCLVILTRTMSGKRWWHQELVADNGWYVPGMAQGELVDQPADPGEAHCLPRALLLVRNVSLTGSWTADALATMSQPVPWFGPFLMTPPDPGTITTDVSGAQQTTVVGAGTQVIGVLCSPLPTLPPRNDPSVAPDNGPLPRRTYTPPATTPPATTPTDTSGTDTSGPDTAPADTPDPSVNT